MSDTAVITPPFPSDDARHGGAMLAAAVFDYILRATICRCRDAAYYLPSSPRYRRAARD
jgi:hypothetical protein